MRTVALALLAALGACDAVDREEFVLRVARPDVVARRDAGWPPPPPAAWTHADGAVPPPGAAPSLGAADAARIDSMQRFLGPQTFSGQYWGAAFGSTIPFSGGL